MFFIVASASSAVAEVTSRWTKKRAKDLERGIAALLNGEPVEDKDLDEALRNFKETSVWKSIEAAINKPPKQGKPPRGPSYLSAKHFADGIFEMLLSGKAANRPIPENLNRRLKALKAEERLDLVSIKSALESWFDESMARVEGSYKRWATWIILAVGVFLTICLNLSTISVARDLWQDPVTRDSVATASEKLLTDGATAEELTSVAKTADELKEVGIPGGWTEARRHVWTQKEWSWAVNAERATDIGGWALTGLLVMFGAPFWFETLGRLVSLRGAGTKPATAAIDPTSATSAITQQIGLRSGEQRHMEVSRKHYVELTRLVPPRSDAERSDTEASISTPPSTSGAAIDFFPLVE